MHAYVWLDGEVVPAARAAVSVFDRTLLYGLGAFETFRLHGGEPFLVDRHVERLQRSLAAVGLPAPAALAGLPSGVRELAARNDAPNTLCRVTVTAGAGPDLGAGCAPSRAVAILRAVPPPARAPVSVGIAPFLHDRRSPLAGVKTTSYLQHYLQRDAAETAGRLDDLMIDEDGCITEGTVSNAFAVRDGRLITPPVSVAILAGVTRGVVLELARASGVPVDERPLPLGELERVDEFFLTGAGKCLVAADLVGERTLPARRPVTTSLRSALIARIASECRVAADTIRI